MIYNSKYFDHLYILNRLSRVYKQKQFNDDDVMVWCQEVEREIIADVEHMPKYEEIDIEVTNGILTLPCNLYRLLDVYDSSEGRILYQSNGTNLYGLKDTSGNEISDGTTIYINYRGSAIDLVTGIPLCLRGHEFVCETFVKIRAFEEDSGLQKFPYNTWQMWNTQLGGQVTAAKQNYINMDRSKINDITIIKGNMIPRIGNLPLSHNQFNSTSNSLI